MGTEQAPGAGEDEVASVARVYSSLLGDEGHSLPADRRAANEILLRSPRVPKQAATNRAFLRRAVRQLVKSGVRQFLDVGCGIPVPEGNVHDIAQRIDPGAGVVYVDVDPVAVMAANQGLHGNRRAVAIEGDITEPGDLLAQLDHPRLRQVVDLSEPTAVLLVALLHFVADDMRPYEAVAALRDQLAVGSHLVISHGAAEAFSKEEVERVRAAYRESGAQAPTPRTREEVARLFGDFALLDPGVVWLPQWQHDPEDPGLFVDEPVLSGSHCGVGIKRS